MEANRLKHVVTPNKNTVPFTARPVRAWNNHNTEEPGPSRVQTGASTGTGADTEP